MGLYNINEESKFASKSVDLLPSVLDMRCTKTPDVINPSKNWARLVSPRLGDV